METYQHLGWQFLFNHVCTEWISSQGRTENRRLRSNTPKKPLSYIKSAGTQKSFPGANGAGRHAEEEQKVHNLLQTPPHFYFFIFHNIGYLLAARLSFSLNAAGRAFIYHQKQISFYLLGHMLTRSWINFVIIHETSLELKAPILCKIYFPGVSILSLSSPEIRTIHPLLLLLGSVCVNMAAIQEIRTL